MVIDLQKIQAGMILSEDILHPKGGIVLKKYQPISPDLISVLYRLGISKISIMDTQINQNTHKDTPTEQVPSSVQLILQQDLMSVTLIINPTFNFSTVINKNYIKQLLSSKNIIYGIDETLIDITVAQWNQQKKPLEVKNIAKGTPAQAAETEGYHIIVPYIWDDTLLERIRNAHYYWEIAKILPENIRKIKPGTVIAEKRDAKPSIPGMNILGESVYSNETIDHHIIPSEGVSDSEDGKCIIAKKQGIAFLTKNSIAIHTIDYDGSIEISVSDDKMSSFLIVHQCGDEGSMPSEQQIRKMLKDRGIQFGINENHLKSLVESFSNGKFPSEPITIAEGRSPRMGVNGIVKYLFDIQTSLKPGLNPDGSVDYKKVSIIQAVDKEQKLAQLIAPISGISGINVFGQSISCSDGIPANLPIGPNTMIDPQNSDFLIASTNGFVRLTNSIVEVNEGLVIPGHVDFSTGNINYAKNVIINGDVKSGFDINCGGDLQVEGTIEDCKITIGGNILCRLGFIGQGKGIIEAEGNVNLNFTKNQAVKSKQSISIAKEAINCILAAKNSITVHGKPLSVAGGNLLAGKSIILHSVGNHTGIKTILEVGIDFTIKEELERKETFLRELTKNYSKLQEAVQKYERMQIIHKTLNPKDQFLFAKTVESISKFKQQIEIIELQKEEIKERMFNPTDAYIKIEHSAMPGTLLKFGERHFLVKDEIVGPKTVRLINCEFKII